MSKTECFLVTESLDHRFHVSTRRGEQQWEGGLGAVHKRVPGMHREEREEKFVIGA